MSEGKGPVTFSKAEDSKVQNSSFRGRGPRIISKVEDSSFQGRGPHVVSKVEDSSFRGRGPLELVSSPHLVLIKPPRCDLPQRLGTYPAGLVPSRTIL